MRGAGWIAAGAAALVLAAGAGPLVAAQGVGLKGGAIARVEDGRTLALDAGEAAPLTVRLAWIRVPAAPSATARGEPHGAEARQRLEVWKGQPVEIVAVGRDRDGVPLVELLWRPTAESVVTLNYEMVRSGFARAECSLEGAFELQCRVLRRAEELARRERRGLWASP